MLQTLSAKSREERIREEFAAVGGSMSTAAFGRHCLDAAVFSEDEQTAFVLRAVQAEIRRVLKHPDATGLPFAGQTTRRDDDGGRVWEQRSLWQYDDYELNIGELLTQRDTLQHQADLLTNECLGRFGRAPGAVAMDRAAD